MFDYCSLQSKGLLSVNDAIDKITSAIVPVTSTEQRSLKNALDRILAVPIYAPINLPSDTNASMDGYAISSEDIDQNKPFDLTLVGTSWAGRPFQGELQHGQCLRIFTGAVLPKAADSVIIQEQVDAKNQKIKFPAAIKAFENIRTTGEDIKIGQCLINPPKKLTAIDLGLLAAAGVYDVAVTRKLKIAFFSTGDELIAIGKNLEPGQIYDSNRYTLNALLDNKAYCLNDLGVIGDNKEFLKKQLLEAAKEYDVIISTGGASVGEADHIKAILDEIGVVSFWKIAMKPGKPLAFGHINQCVFFGLPGNPVSVIATFHQLVEPALRLLCGNRPAKKLRLFAQCTSELKKMPGRQEYQRGIFTQQDDGHFLVKSTGKQGSHILSATSTANCYIVLPEQCAGVKAGSRVIVEPFDTFL